MKLRASREPALFLAGLLAQGRAQDVAQRRAGVGRAELLDGFLVLGHFQGLDRQGDAAGGLVDVGDLGVEAVADGEALGALLGAVARQVGLADEGGHRRVVVAELHLDAAAR